MTITKAVWYKKTCRTIIYSTASFLIFTLSKQGCAGELMLSSSSPHCQGSFSHKYLAAAVLSQHERQGAGWSRVRGWRAEGGELSKWEERRQTSIQRPDALSKVSCRDTALCSSYAITSKVCTAQTVPQPACKGWTGGSRAAGRRSIMILIALPRC